jgi:hypothetical protein
MRIVQIVYKNPDDGRETRENVSSIPQFRARVEAISAKLSKKVNMPFGIDLEDGTENGFTFAIGADRATLIYYDAKKDACFNCVGDSKSFDDSEFYLFGHKSWVNKKHQIPPAAAWAVIEEWADRGTLSSRIEWATE